MSGAGLFNNKKFRIRFIVTNGLECNAFVQTKFLNYCSYLKPFQ